MRAYYNEIDPYCAEWLYNLQRANLIAPGDIDTRPIQDVRPSDLRGYTQCHFFAGLGGWSYALRRAGWRDDRPVWTGSCPCQPFSQAGRRRGFADDRHLWPFWRYLVAVERPAVVFGEQVASAADWLRLVRGDMEALGYAVGAMPVEAASAGADHLRNRYWLVAEDVGDAEGIGWLGRPDDENERRRQRASGHSGAGGVGLADAHEPRSQGRDVLPERAGQRSFGANGVADSDYARRRTQSERRDVDYRHDSRRHQEIGGFAERGQTFEWVTGADGKQRRIKSGVRLLAHGLPRGMAALGSELRGLAEVAGLDGKSLKRAKAHRIGSLRGFGNAIDWRPAARFIEAYMTAL